MGTSASTSKRKSKSQLGDKTGLGSLNESTFSDFEAVDKPPSPSANMGSSSVLVESSATLSKMNPNDLATSGILVEMTEEEKALMTKRRIVKASKKSRDQRPSSPVILSSSTLLHPNESPEEESKHKHALPATALGKSQETDTELLKESLEADRKQRLQKLQSAQKNKRNKAIEDRRKHGKTSSEVAQANPFSRFLKAFSVESEFPTHKRAHELNENEDGIDPKRPKLNDDDEDSTLPSVAKILDWLDDRLPEGWGYMAMAAVSTCLAVTVTLRLIRGSQPKMN